MIQSTNSEKEVLLVSFQYRSDCGNCHSFVINTLSAIKIIKKMAHKAPFWGGEHSLYKLGNNCSGINRLKSASLIMAEASTISGAKYLS